MRFSVRFFVRFLWCECADSVVGVASARRIRTTMTQYEPDDASDSDEDTRRRGKTRDGDGEWSERESEDEALDWDTFWTRATARNEAKMRAAGLDPSKEESRVKFGRHGQALDRGRPREGEQVYCFGCERACGDAYECAQCLETYRARAKKVAYDSWERAFFCSHACYAECWETHKTRHAATTAGPTKTDGQVHEFEAPPGNGALWHTSELRRVEFEECVPMMQ